MAKIEIYSTMICPFCFRAKALLRDKGLEFEEIDVLMNGDRKREMVARAGGRTSVPQIFIDDAHVGGCDDLFDAAESGALDRMLGCAA